MSSFLDLLTVFMIVLLLALLWHQLFRISSEESMAFSAIFIMTGVFLCGVAGNAKMIYYLLVPMCFAGLIAFLFNISVRGRKRDKLLSRLARFVNPSVFCMVLLFAYTVMAFKGAVFTYPDELSQWGMAIKYMSQTDKLPYGAAFQGDAGTLSIATMFQYVWIGLCGFYEKNCFVGNYLLAMIPVYLPFSGITWKNWKQIFAYTLTIFLTWNIMSYIKYYTLLQDYVLPMWTGGVIAWLLWKKGKKLNWLLLAGSLMCIGSMKSMVGPLFAIIILLVIIIRQIYTYKPKSIKEFINGKTVYLALVLPACTLLLSSVWTKLAGQSMHVRSVSYYAPEKNFFKITTGMVNKIFYMVSGSVEAVPNLSYFIFWLFTIIILFVLMGRFSKERDNKLFTIVFSLYSVGFVLYLFVMYYAYVNVFGAADAESVAGLERYLSYYMLIGCVPLISLLFMRETIKLHWNKYLKIVSITLIVLLTFGTGGGFVSKATAFNLSSEEGQNDQDSVYTIRLKASKEKELFDRLGARTGKIYILGTLSMNEAKALSYELGNRYIWHENSHRVYTRYRGDVTVYQDIVKYPHLLEVYGHEYIWCKFDTGDKKRYLPVSYRLNMNEWKNGAFYRLVKTEDGLSTEYLGNIEELLEEDD